MEEELTNIFPKKEAMYEYKCKVTMDKRDTHIFFVVADSTPWFFQIRDGPYFPTLRTLHKFPDLLPKVQVDQGGIKHVMRGANIMCRGLTSEGGSLGEVELDKDTPVAVMAEGKELALAVGLLDMSTTDIKEKNDGMGVLNVHYLGDGLWLTREKFE